MKLTLVTSNEYLSSYIINQAKVLKRTPLFPMYILGHCFKLFPGGVATDPVIWGMLQHLLLLKLHLCSQMKIKLTDDSDEINGFLF